MIPTPLLTVAVVWEGGGVLAVKSLFMAAVGQLWLWLKQIGEILSLCVKLTLVSRLGPQSGRPFGSFESLMNLRRWAQWFKRCI